MELAARALLDQTRPLLLRVIQQSRLLDPPPANSWLGRVDDRTRPFESSQHVRVFALVAADNLQQVERTLRRGLPPFALYSLIRSAVEASSLGLWILDARDEQLAASRMLRIYRQHIASDRSLHSTFSSSSSPVHDRLHQEAQRLHGELPGIRGSDFERAVKSTDVIRVVDSIHSLDGDPMHQPVSGLGVWRATSSITHANSISIAGLLERHPDGILGDAATRTSSLSVVASFYATACSRASTLITLFRLRSQLRRAGR
jgi:hypothetical protein